MTPQYYIDNNILNYLAVEAPEQEALRASLKRMVDQGSIKIYGSFELFGEAVGAIVNRPEKYETMRDTFFELCGDRIFRPTDQIWTDERETGAGVPLDNATVSREVVERLHGLSTVEDACHYVAKATGERKDRSGQSMESAFGSSMKAVSGQFSKRDRKEARDQAVVRRSAVAKTLWEQLPGEIPGDRATGEADIACVPCLSSFVAMRFAEAWLHFKEGREPKNPHDYDARHYSLATMCGRFVTEDKALIAAAELVEWKPVHVLRVGKLKEEIIGIQQDATDAPSACKLRDES